MKRMPEPGIGGSNGDIDDDKPSSFTPHKGRAGRLGAGIGSVVKLAAAYVALLLVARALRHAALPVGAPLFDRTAANEDSAGLYAETLDDDAQPPPPPVAQASAPAAVPVPVWYGATTRYLVFQPSGGISNQRKILSWALRVCAIVHRTCVLPHVAPHTTWYYKYNQVALQDLAPAHAVYDLDLMPVPVVELADVTLDAFATAHANKLGGKWHVIERSSLREMRANPWSAQDVERMFGALEEQFLYLR